MGSAARAERAVPSAPSRSRCPAHRGRRRRPRPRSPPPAAAATLTPPGRAWPHGLAHEIARAVELPGGIGGIRGGADDILAGLDHILTRRHGCLARIEDTLADIDHLHCRIADGVEAEDRHDGDTGGDEEDEEAAHHLRRYVALPRRSNSPRAFPGTSYDRLVEIGKGPWTDHRSRPSSIRP